MVFVIIRFQHLTGYLPIFVSLKQMKYDLCLAIQGEYLLTIFECDSK